jgi:hypothetical protein
VWRDRFRVFSAQILYYDLDCEKAIQIENQN